MRESLYDRFMRHRREATQRGEPEWLEATDVPLPEWPLDPVAFGPPLVADPTSVRDLKTND